MSEGAHVTASALARSERAVGRKKLKLKHVGLRVGASKLGCERRASEGGRESELA